MVPAFSAGSQNSTTNVPTIRPSGPLDASIRKSSRHAPSSRTHRASYRLNERFGCSDGNDRAFCARTHNA